MQIQGGYYTMVVDGPAIMNFRPKLIFVCFFDLLYIRSVIFLR